jgi:hypothetical protein
VNAGIALGAAWALALALAFERRRSRDEHQHKGDLSWSADRKNMQLQS